MTTVPHPLHIHKSLRLASDVYLVGRKWGTGRGHEDKLNVPWSECGRASFKCRPVWLSSTLPSTLNHLTYHLHRLLFWLELPSLSRSWPGPSEATLSRGPPHRVCVGGGGQWVIHPSPFCQFYHTSHPQLERQETKAAGVQNVQNPTSCNWNLQGFREETALDHDALETNQVVGKCKHYGQRYE